MEGTKGSLSDLSGRVVLLTGASKGIGAAAAAILGACGADLIAHFGSDRAGVDAATADIPDERKRIIQADLATPDGADALWRAAINWRGHVDVVVNNAAIMLWHGGIDDSDDVWDDAWTQTLQVNVYSPARLLRAAVRHFRQRGGGVIITISSWSAQRGSTNPDTIAYAASKAAIRATTQTIARGYARDGVLAYVVAPGVVRTQMSVNFAATQGGEAPVSAGLAMGEWVPPEDIGRIVAFLAAGKARHLTGATLDVNGASYVR
jgi:NAD(P)-dependent dehydrogenase (short-subunit alcohol dehydrogenase family)